MHTLAPSSRSREEEQQPLKEGSRMEEVQQNKSSLLDGRREGGGLLLETPPRPPPWVNVTESLLAQVQDLKIGEIVMPLYFDLRNAMAAVQINDPKVDIGMALSPAQSAIHARKRTVGDALTLNLSVPDVIGVMDGCIAQFVAWLHGGYLPLTLFTCIFTATPCIPCIPSLPLRAFVIGLLKCVGIIRRQITLARIFNDEDFAGDSFSFDLCSLVHEIEALNDLNKAIDSISIRNNHETSEKLPLEASALICRLNFLVILLEALSKVDAETPPIYFQPSKASAFISSLRSGLNILQQIRNSMSIASDASDFFDPDLNRHLYFQAPPTMSESLSPEQALDSLHSILNDLIYSVSFVNPESFSNLYMFARKRIFTNPKMSIWPRSVLYTHLKSTLFQSLRHTCQLVIQDLHSRSHFPLSFDEEEQNSKCQGLVRTFVHDLSPTLERLFQVQCKNKSRVHRDLINLLPDLDSGQFLAEELDERMNELLRGQTSFHMHFSSFLYDIKVNVMIQILLMGFQLELYAHHEIPMIFCYLEHLFTSMKTHLNWLHRITNSAPLEPTKTAYAPSLASGMSCLSRAYLLMTVVSIEAGLIKPIQSGSFYQPHMHYAYRFRAFSNLGSPEYLTYEAFQKKVEQCFGDRSDSGDHLNALILTAISAFKKADSILSLCLADVGEVSPLKRACHENVSFCQSLTLLCNAPIAGKTKKQLSIHDLSQVWPIFKLIDPKSPI